MGTKDEASLRDVVSKAKAVLEGQHAVEVDEEALRTLAETIDPQDCREPTVGLPLKFDNDMQEINLHATTALLSFGAHFEQEGRLESSAKDTVLYGIIGLHISKNELDGAHYRSIFRSDVVEYFGINPMEMVRDEKVPIIQIEKPGKMSEYVDDIMEVLKETGARLGELACVSMARFILDALKAEATASRLISALHAAFPHFRDEPDASIPLDTYKKPLILAVELYHRLRKKVPALAFPDYETLPPFVTSGIVNSLFRKGVIRAAAGEEPAAADQVLTPPHASTVIAAAIVALDRLTELLVEKGGQGLAAVDVSFYVDSKAVAEQKESSEGPRWDPGRSTTW